MSPVHVIVSESPEDERHYGVAFGGAIDLYRFRSNVEAFERLTSAAAPIHVLVLTPNQGGVFNMDPAQLVARLQALPVTPVLSALQVVVVGTHPGSPAAGAHYVSTLDAAVRLIKFGQVESAPMPPAQPLQAHVQPAAPAQQAVPAQPATPAQRAQYPAPPVSAMPELSLPPQQPVRPSYQQAPVRAQDLASSVISAIWDAPERPSVQPVQQQPHMQQQPQMQPAAPAAGQRVQLPRGTSQMRGGPAAAPAPQAPAQRSTAPALFSQAPAQPQVAPEQQLEPAVPYHLSSRGVYRGEAVRNGRVHASSVAQASSMQASPQHATPQYAPPAPAPAPQPQQVGLAAQVQQIVYQATPHTGDPLLGFSAPVQQQLAAQQQVAMVAPAFAPVAPQLAVQQPQQFVAHATVAQPNAPQAQGRFARMRERVREAERAPVTPQVAASVTPQQAPAAAGAFQAPQAILQRAEAAGDVSFG